MALNGSYTRPRMISSTASSNTSNSRYHLSSDEAIKIEDGTKCASGQGHTDKASVPEDSISVKAEGARPKTPGGTRRPNKLKQGKTLSTSMEIWQIQKELKRGEMVQVSSKYFICLQFVF